MKKILSICGSLLLSLATHAQTNPAITKWLFNTSGTTARYYLTGSTTPYTDVTLANVQQVKYSANYAYVSATGSALLYHRSVCYRHRNQSAEQ